MGTIIDRISAAFRDFTTDGVAASGLHETVKSEVRAIGPVIEAAIANAGLGALVSVVKDNRANLNADLAHAAASVALVYADATDANNDLYVKVGASGTGSWTLTNALHTAVSNLTAPFLTTAAASATSATASATSASTLVGAAVSQLEERSRVWQFEPHGSSSGLSYNSDGNYTLTAGGSALWIINNIETGAVGGGPFEMRIRFVSGSFVTPTIWQYGASGNLSANLTFTVEGDTIVARTTALHASCTSLWLNIANSGGGAVAAVFAPPRYVVTGTGRSAAVRGVPNARQAGLAADAAAKQAPNLFRSDWTAAALLGSGAVPVRIGSRMTVINGRSGIATSILSGIDITQPIACECRSDISLVNASVEFLFAGGSPANLLFRLADYGNYFGIVIPPNTLTATPISARFVINNLSSAAALRPLGTATTDGFTIKNAARLSGEMFEGWIDRTQTNRINDLDARDLATLRRWRSAHTAAARARALSEPLHVEQAAGALAFAMATSTMWVDAVNGNDANSGARTSPKKTFAAAIAATTSGDTIMLRAGQDHDPGPEITNLNRSVFGWGDGERRARIDARQRLATATWTNVSGNMWKTDVVHREGLGLGRSLTLGTGASNLYNFGLWFPGDVLGTYLAGVDGIVARSAAVAAAAGSWFVHKTGSTNSEPRSESGNDAATNFTYYVNMPDGSDPNGKDIRVADRGSLGNWSHGGRLQNLDFIGGARKDHISFATSTVSGSDALRILENCRMIDTPEHGLVGIVQVRGYYFANGRSSPNCGVGGRALGSPIDLFSPSANPTVDINMGLVEISNYALGIFGHGAGSPTVIGGARSLRIRCIIATNMGDVIGFSGLGTVGSARNPYWSNGITIDWVDAVGIASLTTCGAAITFNGGWVEMEARNDGNIQALLNSSILAGSITLNSVMWTMGQLGNLASVLVVNGTPDTTPGFVPPVLTLNDCRDLSPVAIKGKLASFGGVPSSSKVTFVINGSTKIGAIINNSNNYLPAGLTIAAGAEAGLFNEDRAGIIARLTAASVPNSIDAAARIVTNLGANVSDLVAAS